MTDPAIGAIETEVAMLLRRAETGRRSGEPHNALDRSAYLVLRRLDEHGPQTVRSIAAALGLDSSAVARQVAGMVRDGLVRRSRSATNGRASLVAPTPVGLRRMTGVRAARQELYTQVLATWPDADRRTLASLLTRLNHALAAHLGR